MIDLCVTFRLVDPEISLIPVSKRPRIVRRSRHLDVCSLQSRVCNLVAKMFAPSGGFYLLPGMP